MKLVVKRVLFGDCCVLEGRRQRLIVDCGSDSREPKTGRSPQAFAYSAIRAEINDPTPTSALISHLHSDHFCGFLSLPVEVPRLSPGLALEWAYLPLTIVHERAALADSIARLLAVAPPGSYGLRLADRVTALFDRLLHAARRIRMVQAGDRIPLEGSASLEVLWPRVQCALEKLPLKIDGYADKLPFLAWDRLLYQQFALLREDQALQSASPELRSRLNRLLDSSYAVGETLERYLLLLTGEELAQSGRREAFHQFQDALENLKEAHSSFWEMGMLPDSLRQRLLDYYLFQYHVLVKGFNATSVVCQWGDRLLLTGDAPRSIIRLLSKDDCFHSSYQVVKLPHHGTWRYYTPALPAARHYIVSNGGFPSRRVGRIALDRLSAACPDCTFHCTNAHEDPDWCEYLGLQGFCHPACVPIRDPQLRLPL